MYSPNKMIGGMVGALGDTANLGATSQQTGALSGITQQPGALAALPPQQMTNVPPAPSNTLGQAQPVFNPQAKQNAQGMFGNQQALQNSVGASPLFQKQLGNRGAYQPTNPGDLLDESVHDKSNYNSTNAGKISGMKYNIENLSEIQKDKDGQFVVSLDDSEGLSSGPSRTVSNYDQGKGAVRDTLRPAVGKKFYNLK
jgi:hypothetical protein